MFKRKIKTFLILLLSLFVLCNSLNIPVFAADANETYYLGENSLVNAGNSNGYSKTEEIKGKDPHYGWKLGHFFITGFTRSVKDSDEPIFLKTTGDKVTLWFRLEQDIDCLNDDSNLSIETDTKGYDEYFGTKKTDAGCGMLIVRHTDYQGLMGEPQIYTDYLSASATVGADTQVQLCEEGDYEVALDYKVKKVPLKVKGISIAPQYYSYRIFFKFSIRNGNCMVYPFDIGTGSELSDCAFTENGFYLDLANSHYLDIDIKKEILSEGANGLTEDTRFNKPAKDKEQFTDEGIYTFTVRNTYTDEKTEKVIYVGTNSLLKAYVTTGLPIEEIQKQIDAGAEIAADGTIIPVSIIAEPETPVEDVQSPMPDVSAPIEPQEGTVAVPKKETDWFPIVTGAAAIFVCVIVVIIVKSRKNSTKGDSRK